MAFRELADKAKDRVALARFVVDYFDAPETVSIPSVEKTKTIPLFRLGAHRLLPNGLGSRSEQVLQSEES